MPNKMGRNLELSLSNQRNDSPPSPILNLLDRPRNILRTDDFEPDLFSQLSKVGSPFVFGEDEVAIFPAEVHFLGDGAVSFQLFLTVLTAFCLPP